MKLSGDDFSSALRSGYRAAQLIRITISIAAIANLFATSATAQLTALRVEDYATVPMSGTTAFPSPTANGAYLARVNFMADEPGDSNRFFLNDLNGQLYILDKTTKSFTEYLNFNGRDAAPGLYDRLWTEAGFAGGFVTFQFDPDYVQNGKFYTVHMERSPNPNPGSELPNNANYPNLDLTNYGVTASIDAPGGNTYKHVLVEWTDTNINNTAFEGSARELLRMDARDRIHPIGDIVFNPTAGPADSDWRVMYISVGDSSNGEQPDVNARRTPQLLNALGGKILRIAPDTNVNVTTTASPNGKYRIPNDNPFTEVANAAVRDEVYALGLRNPHRMSWDVDPADPDPETNNHLIANDIGLHTWEEVNIIHKGGNYGYSQREGNQLLISTIGETFNETAPLPAPDLIDDQVVCTGSSFNVCSTNGTTTPLYPVIQYGHGLAGQDQLVAGDSISSGFVYRGSKIPQLYGKYLFGDITTGTLYYADFAEMLDADDGDPSTLAAIHSLDVLWDNPNDAPDNGEQIYATLTSSDAIRGPMFQIVEAGYEARGGLDSNLPGGASVTGAFGRADIRIQVGAEGELYILSKSDGMIRAITGPEPLPGDYNYDGAVDVGDFDVWKAAYGTTVPRLGLWADGNQDGLVDAADFTVWRDHATVAGGGSVSVPEPASALLLAVAAVMFFARRRAR